MTARARDRQLALLVDDDPMMRLLAARALEMTGLRVAEAGTGEEALLLVEREVPDLIVLDVQMPGMGGFAACAALRGNPLLQHVPILMMTGLEDTESVSRAYEVGATDFVGKPVHWQLLGHRVRYLLRSAAAFREVSESRAQLARSEGLLAAAHRIGRIATWEWDAKSGALTWSSARDRRLGEHLELPGTLAQYFRLVHPGDRRRVKERFRAALDTTVGDRLEHRVIDAMGEVRLIELEFEPTAAGPMGGMSGIHGTARDMTERWRAQERIHHLAYHDVLTGLPNRQLFMQQASTAIAVAVTESSRMALLFVDLDGFKSVNDTYGHGVGDALLRAVADRLRAAMRGRGVGTRTDDSVARIGGDEFVALITDLPDDDVAAELAQRLLDTIGAPLFVEGHQLHVSGSIGIAICPRDGADYDVLLRKADAAMYQAKLSGRGMARMHVEVPGEDRHPPRRGAREGGAAAAVDSVPRLYHHEAC